MESAELSTSLVIKHEDGHIEPFSRDKLFVSIHDAVGHRQSPAEDAGALTATISTHLLKRAESAAIRPADVISVALQVLQRFDNAAAVQYGAYHHT
jgi:transcriptional regulator NrdR family protein